MNTHNEYIGLVRDAGDILLRFHRKGFSVSHKGSRDLVTDADLAVEKFIKKKLHLLAPEVPFLGEESAKGERYATCFILDPLDGTTNFAHGFPAFCVSLAYMEKNKLVWGAVLDPLRGELFHARLGKGAFLNRQRIRVSSQEKLEQSLLATGFPYTNGEPMARNLNYFNHVLPFCHGIRRAGAAALDLCYTACGRFDGFFELTLHPWDVAAGMLIISEAGGMVTNIDGSPSSPYDEKFVATNSLIHEALLEKIAAAEKHFPRFRRYFRSDVLGED